MGFKSIALGATIIFLSSSASASVISTENFNAGASGWSPNITSNLGGNVILGGYGVFGAGVVARKDYVLQSGQSTITIDFDFYRIDSWDNERFIVEANGTTLASNVYNFSGGTHNIGGNGSFRDEKVHYSLSFDADSTLLSLAFRSTLNQGSIDESWGVDNLVISQTVNAVPVPAAVWLFGSGLLGLVGVARRKSQS